MQYCKNSNFSPADRFLILCKPFAKPSIVCPIARRGEPIIDAKDFVISSPNLM